MAVVYILKDGSEHANINHAVEWQYTNDQGEVNHDAVGRAVWGKAFSRVAFTTGQPRRVVTNRDGFCRYIESEPYAVMEIYFHHETRYFTFGQPYAMVAKVWASPALRDDWSNREQNALLFYIWGSNADLPVTLQGETE